MGQIKQATGKLLSKLEFVDEIWKKADFKDKWLNTFGKELLQEYKDYNYLCEVFFLKQKN